MSTDPKARAWMEIRAEALLDNLARIRGSVGPGPRMIPMVKADAYGLGVAETVSALGGGDVWGFGVATVEEGVHLRDLGVRRPVLVFSPVAPGAEDAAVGAGLVLSVSDLGTIGRLRAAALERGAPAEFHVEIDTGMGRAGLAWEQAAGWAPRARDLAGSQLRWTGCFTHLHSADEDAASVREQWRRFTTAVVQARPAKGGVLLHVLNSAGALRCPEYAADAVRPGIFLYGGSAGPDLPSPRAVAAVRARVVHVRDAPDGTTVGYGATYRSSGPERWATVAIGYGDGLPRVLGNRGAALVRGRKAPIVGRISMDVTVVDITGVPGVQPGDVVTFVGSDGSERITLDEVAEQAGTISYEVLTGFTARLPRLWLGNEHGS